VFTRFFKKRAFSPSGLELYRQAVLQGRTPAFYSALDVPDSLDGRFELVALHCYLLLRRMKAEEPDGTDLGQELAEIFFADMDVNLREIGASDIGVGRRVKRMIEAFYGRARAYDAGLAEGPGALAEALRRNLYGTTEPSPAALSAVADYTLAADRLLAEQTWHDLKQGRVRFPGVAADRSENVAAG